MFTFKWRIGCFTKRKVLVTVSVIWNAKLFSAGVLKMVRNFIWLKTNLANESPLLDMAYEWWQLSVSLEKPFWVQHGVVNISYPSTPSFLKPLVVFVKLHLSFLSRQTLFLRFSGVLIVAAVKYNVIPHGYSTIKYNYMLSGLFYSKFW